MELMTSTQKKMLRNSLINDKMIPSLKAYEAKQKDVDILAFPTSLKDSRAAFIVNC
jgi:hypothetical protein